MKPDHTAASSFAMTGCTSPPVRERDADKPIPFRLTDAPIPHACSDFAPTKGSR